MKVEKKIFFEEQKADIKHHVPHRPRRLLLLTSTLLIDFLHAVSNARVPSLFPFLQRTVADYTRGNEKKKYKQT